MDSKSTVTVSGYPGSVYNNPSANNQALYKADGEIMNINQYNSNLFYHQIMYNTYTSGDDSGAPVYITKNVNDEGKNIVIGIHTSGCGTQRY